jgi:hypothetical protein
MDGEENVYKIKPLSPLIKKTLLISILVALTVITVVHADITGAVYGTVYQSEQNETPVDDVLVTVSCYADSNGPTFIEEVSNVSGFTNPGVYWTRFTTCGEGNYAQACAEDVCSDYVMLTIRNSHIATARINLFLDEEEVPEFGTIALGLAGIGALAGIFLIRKK